MGPGQRQGRRARHGRQAPARGRDVARHHGAQACRGGAQRERESLPQPRRGRLRGDRHHGAGSCCRRESPGGRDARLHRGRDDRAAGGGFRRRRFGRARRRAHAVGLGRALRAFPSPQGRVGLSRRSPRKSASIPRAPAPRHGAARHHRRQAGRGGHPQGEGVLRVPRQQPARHLLSLRRPGAFSSLEPELRDGLRLLVGRDPGHESFGLHGPERQGPDRREDPHGVLLRRRRGGSGPGAQTRSADPAPLRRATHRRQRQGLLRRHGDRHQRSPQPRRATPQVPEDGSRRSARRRRRPRLQQPARRHHRLR